LLIRYRRAMPTLSQRDIRALAKSIVEASPAGIRFSDR